MKWLHAFRKDTVLFYALLTALYAAILAAKFALWNSNALQSDWTYYNNIFWNTNFHNLWLFSYDRSQLQGYVTYLNEHFAPLLIPFAGLYHIVPWPEGFLLALHGASPIIAAIGIRAIGIRLLGDRQLATCIALVFAFNPGILWPTISLVYGFEPDCMLPPVAAMVGYAIATRRTGLFFAGLLIGCTIKENVPAYGVILGACLIIFTDWRKQGFWSIAVSLAAFLLASKGVPYFTGVKNNNINIVWIMLEEMAHLRLSLDYTLPEIVFALGYCTFFIPALFVLPFLAAVGPDLLAIGRVAWATTGTWHIMLPVTLVGIASVFGSSRFLVLSAHGVLAVIDRHIGRARLLRYYWYVGLIVSLVAGPTTLWLAYNRYVIHAVPIDRGALAVAIKLVPPDAGIATTNDLDQYFAHRRIVTTRPQLLLKKPSDFSYLLVNRSAPISARVEDKAASSYLSDKCLIIIAEKIAETKDTIMLDRGNLLLVKLDKAPLIDCN